MRKQTKIAALVSAAALLAIGASMTSFAAGWTFDNSIGHWVYEDSDGYRVTDEWKKWTDGRWCYLGDDGVAVANQLVPYEDYLYAVDSEGYRVLNDWWQEDNVDAEEVNGVVPNTIWYRLAATTGRAVGGTATIDGQKFRFDSENRMITGWYEADDGSWYYYEDRVSENDHTYGAALSGWVELPPRNGDEPTDQDVALVYYYFDANGKSQTGSVYYNKRWYYLGDNGQLQKSTWTEVEGNKAASNVGTASGAYMYAGSDGAKKTGWQYVSDKGLANAKNADYWFYMMKNGVRFMPAGKTYTATLEGSTDQKNVVVGLATISGKNYLFDSDGRMLTGLWKADVNITSELGSSFVMNKDNTYLFSSDDYDKGGSCGWMITNAKVSSSSDGIDTNYQFDSKGHRYEDAIVKGVYYGSDGKRVDAYYDYDVVENPGAYVLTKSGAVVDTTSTTPTPTVKLGANILVSYKGVAQKDKKVSNVGGYMTYYTGTKMPSKSDVTAAGFSWDPIVATAVAAGDAKAAAAVGYDKLTAAQKEAAKAAAEIDAVKTYVTTAANGFTGYEIIATMN